MSESASSSVAGPFRTLLGAAATLLVLALCIAGLGRYRDLKVQRARESILIERIAATDRRISELSRTIRLLKEDPGTLERAAREDLGMARPEDVIIRDSGAPQNTGAPH